MKLKTFIIITFLILWNAIYSQDTININFFISQPFCTNNNNTPGGLEIDIINDYLLWLKVNKKQNIAVKYNPFTDFNEFYSKTKSSNKNTIGLGSVSITQERQKEVDFTVGYIKNVAFCITNGNAADIKTKAQGEIVKTLNIMSAITISNTSLEKHCIELKKTFLPELKIKYLATSTDILNELAKNVLSFGYVDAVDFWFYLKANPSKFLKMQRVLNQSKDVLGFVLPKGSIHKTQFNEFFTAYKTGKNYRNLLEKYLGSYMTQNLAVN